MKTMSPREAKNAFGLMIDTARAQPALIEKHGRGVVVVVAVEEYERLSAGQTHGRAQPDRVPEAKVGRGKHVTRQSLRDKFIAVLTELDGSAGNGKLCETLGWADAAYDAVKDELIDDGIVTPGRGRGGSVAIAAAAESPPVAPAKPAQTDRPARAERPNGAGANV